MTVLPRPTSSTLHALLGLLLACLVGLIASPRCASAQDAGVPAREEETYEEDEDLDEDEDYDAEDEDLDEDEDYDDEEDEDLDEEDEDDEESSLDGDPAD